MEERIQLLPNGTPIDARLCFGHTFGNGFFDYLHSIRSRGIYLRSDWTAYESSYWSQLDRFRCQFAESVNGNFDLIVDVPSKSGYHRPFLAAFLDRFPKAPVIWMLKNLAVQSKPENLQQLREAIELRCPKGLAIQNRNSVLIVDDVFATGTIATVVVEKLLEHGLRAGTEITIAAPLRVSQKAS